MTENDISYNTLGNGLRCVARRIEIPVEHIGIVVNAGSRDESHDAYGLAHFVEHTIFKGTSRHRAAWVRDRMELVGGELNAYTTKEETAIYSTAPAGYSDRALALIAEMVTDAAFPPAEINREKQVVAEEIDTYLDTPSDAVFDDFEEQIYSGSPLAHNILGTRESLAKFTSDDCRRYIEERFTPGRMVLFYFGPSDSDRVFAKAEKYFERLARSDKELKRTEPPMNSQFDSVNDRADSYQAHTVMGVRIPGLLSTTRFETALLANILGGPGMNSLLNVELREKRGLVYGVDASAALMSDHGLLTVYFGCDPADIDRCIGIVRRTASSLAEKPLSERRLAAAKRQFIGQLTVGSMASEQLAISMGRSTLYRGSVMSLSETIEAVNAITAASLLDAASPLGSLSRLTLL